jgi:hypothetical protein
MIIETYSLFRTIANPGGAIGADGLTEFDPALMRANTFDGGIAVSSVSAFPIALTCVPTQANPNIYPTDLFDWYVSQRTSVSADKPLVVSRGAGTVGDSISLTLAAWASAEYPDPFDLSAIRVLFFAVDIYCIRRADSAIQRLNLARYLLDALSPKTDVG